MLDPFISLVIDPIKSMNFRKYFFIQRSWMLVLFEFTLTNTDSWAARVRKMFQEEKL